ncbi:MAG: STAS domain-containing protein [Nitrospirales bacterium]|nr:STAS domain-containing protein [Nitrospirales bacterium]
MHTLSSLHTLKDIHGKDPACKVMRFAFEQSGDIGLLSCNGELTLHTTGELKAALMKALDSVDHLVCNLEKVPVIDSACFQLLCMAHRISKSLNKRITFIGIRPASFKLLFEDTGAFRRTECVVDCLKAACRWISGERMFEHAGKGDEGLFAGKRRRGKDRKGVAEPAGAQQRW